MSTASEGVIDARRADLDSLRVLALLLLIVYHTLLVFDPNAMWRVLSANAAPWAGYLIAVLSPWRMALVFFVGGCAARFMIERAPTGAFIGERAAKLLTAFAFAVIVLVPLQIFVRRDNVGAPAESYWDYLIRDAPFVANFDGQRLPDFAHAWFLPYLFVYSVALALIWRLTPEWFRRLQGLVERAHLALVVGAVMIWFAFVLTRIEPRWPQTSMLVDDVSVHLKFLPVFMLGALIGKSVAFRQKLLDGRHWLWGAAIVLMLVEIALKWALVQSASGPENFYDALRASSGLYGGAMLFAVCAFGAWTLDRPSKQLSYLSDAILPVYLMHQTVLVVAADAITPRGWQMPLELVTLFALTILLPLAIYHVLIRRNSWLRVLFGLRPAHGEKSAPAPPAPLQPAGSGSNPG